MGKTSQESFNFYILEPLFADGGNGVDVAWRVNNAKFNTGGRLWEPISDGILTAIRRSKMGLINKVVLHSNEDSDGEEIEAFYEQLDAVQERFPKEGIAIVMG